MTKEQLRKLYQQKRRELTPRQFETLNQKLCDQFFSSIDFGGIKVLHTFLPIEKNREVNTWLIIERISHEFPSIRIAIPKVNNQTASIESYYFEGPDQLERNMWGISEPKQGVPVPLEEIDLILVPLLAFDTFGHRVGYGRGFYDKLLSMASGHAKKIGLSLFPSIQSIADVTPSDISLDGVVTPGSFFEPVKAGP